jgi:hypothetical protein
MIKRLKILFLKWQIRINKLKKQIKKNGVRKGFLIWFIPLILPRHHLAGNPKGGGRKKKFDPFIIATGIEEKIEADYKLFDQISKEERDERNKTK